MKPTRCSCPTPRCAGRRRRWRSRAGRTSTLARSARHRPAAGQPEKKGAAPKVSRRTLWVKDGEFVRPLEVAAETSDGAITAVTVEGLHEGDEVVTGEIVFRQADVSNPFLPKIIRR